MDRTGTAGIHDVLVEQAALHPDKDAFVVVDAEGGRHAVTYQAFVADVERCAVALERSGISPGDAVVVHLRTSLDLLTCWFGLLRLGALAVPTNLASPAMEVVHAMGTTGATHVITEPRFDALIDAVAADPDVTVRTRITARRGDAPLAAGAHDLADLLAAVGSDERVAHAPPGGLDPAEVLFTSGTTSRPKGALLTHSNLLRAGMRVSLHYAIGASDRPMAIMPLFHTGGQCMGVMASLVVGATCILTEQYTKDAGVSPRTSAEKGCRRQPAPLTYSASRFFAQVREHGATFVMLVTTHVRTLLAQPPHPEDAAHAIRSMGFGLRITEDERDAFEARFGVRLTYCYGQTEACLNIAIAPLHGPRRWPSLGLPAFDRVIRIIDGEDREVPQGQVGEIVVAADPGRTVLLRYINDPAATAATIRDGWLHTGDNGLLDERGHLHFVDRKKDMIKRAGENISALEVETALTAHPDIDDAAVIGVPDAIRDEAVKAFVVLAAGTSLTVEAVQAHCAVHLASFKVPTEVEFRSDLPRTSIGKVAKGELRAEAVPS